MLWVAIVVDFLIVRCRKAPSKSRGDHGGGRIEMNASDRTGLNVRKWMHLRVEHPAFKVAVRRRTLGVGFARIVGLGAGLLRGTEVIVHPDELKARATRANV